MANAFDLPVKNILQSRFAQDAIIHWPATGGLSRDGTKAGSTTQRVRAFVSNRDERVNGAIVQRTTVYLPATERSLIGATVTIRGQFPRKVATSENVGGAADGAAFQKVTLT